MRLRSAAAAAAATLLTACACGVRPAPMADTPAGEAAAPVDPPAADGEASAPDRAVMTPDGTGGYALSGPYGLAGTVGRIESGAVRLAATLTFPTGGYAVGEVRTILLKRYPEHIIFTIPVQPPAPDAMVTQALTAVSLESETQATEGATFEVRVVTEETPSQAAP